MRMWLFGERLWVREYNELRGCECECEYEFGWVAGWLALLTICLATKNELGLLSAFLPKKTIFTMAAVSALMTRYTYEEGTKL